MVHARRLREACGGDPAKRRASWKPTRRVGGKEGNKHPHKKLNMGRGTVGKQAVLGLRERGGRSIAMLIEGTSKATLHREIAKHR